MWRHGDDDDCELLASSFTEETQQESYDIKIRIMKYYIIVQTSRASDLYFKVTIYSLPAKVFIELSCWLIPLLVEHTFYLKLAKNLTNLVKTKKLKLWTAASRIY